MSTNQEYVLTDSDLIVSKTDLKGIITYINDDFIRIGGFSKKELIGSPHNILRHADMPKAAFADMWKTLKSGNSWTGIVKNRTKNDGFYWVRANVMPLLENGNVIGYLSVRSKPSSAEISDAANLYREMQSGHSKVRLDAGEVIVPSLTKTIYRTFNNITIKSKLVILITLSLLSIAGIAGYAAYGINVIKSTTNANMIENVANQFQQSVILIGLSMTAVLLIFSIATLFSIIRPIARATLLITQTANGDKIQVDEFSKNELGKLMQSIKMMDIKFGFEIAEDKRYAKEMLRIKMALDEVRIPVTLANSQKELIYMNTAARMLWTEIGKEFVKQRFPNFNVDDMFGHSIRPYFEKDEEREIFNQQTKIPNVMLIDLGGKRLRLTVISIYDQDNHYAGRATQWKDITAESAMEEQIERIVKDATGGNFRNRVNVTENSGFFKNLADDLNVLLENCEKSYTDMADIFDALSRGDLSHTITNQYTGEFEDIKNNANNTVYKLTEIVNQIKGITHSVKDSSTEIAMSSKNLAERTNSQASAIQETATSMHELTSTVDSNTDNANHANEFVIGASSNATRGVDVIRRVVTTMEDIREASRKVVDIISVIDGISFQTNILALNAAVEAARAGEQGRGFAVVATEVRSLAQRAAAAAGEIKTLINDSVEKIEDGSKLVVDAGHTMEDIVDSVRTVTEMIGLINIASSEQSFGIGQANQAISEMEEMTQQNAILVEQSTAISDNLKNQATDLSKAVDYFKIG